MEVVDQLGHKILLNHVPRRIVSLVPSITELLVDLGLQDAIIGVTKFCVHPHGLIKKKKLIGGTKSLNLELIKELNPDFIIANKEENEQTQIEELSKIFKVYVSDIKSYDDSIELMQTLGDIFHRRQEVAELSHLLELYRPTPLFNNQSALYLIWCKPYMSIGHDTYIHHIMSSLGLNNVYSSSVRYPIVSDEDLNNIKPSYVFLSSEPYPFQEKHIAELEEIFPQSAIVLVDGEAFSWYGTRILKLNRYFEHLKSNLS